MNSHRQILSGICFNVKCRPILSFFFFYWKVKLKISSIPFTQRTNTYACTTIFPLVFIPLKLLTSFPFPIFSLHRLSKVFSPLRRLATCERDMAATESDLDDFPNLDYELRYPTSLADAEAFMTGLCTAAFQNFLPVTFLFSISILNSQTLAPFHASFLNRL